MVDFCGVLTPRGFYCALPLGHKHHCRPRITVRHVHRARAQKFRNDPANQAKLREYRQSYRDRRGKQVDAYKLARGCVACGYGKNGDPAQAVALDCDHPDPLLKVAEIGVMVTSPRRYPDAVFLAELEKCQILCKNCHAIKTVRDRDRAKGNTREASRRLRRAA
jgi:hypothetical protein